MRPWAGRLADRRGRRPLFVAGALLAALGIAAHTLTADLAMLIGLRLVLGVAEALFFVAGFAILADLAPPNRAGEALSFNSLALYLGLAFGPSTGELLLAVGGFPLVWIGAAALAFAKLPDRVPPYPLAAAALALIAAGMAVAGTLTTVVGLVAGAAIMGVGVAFVTPAFFTAIVARV